MVRPIPDIPDIIEFNRDIEHYVIKSTSSRSEYFYNDYNPLTFVHFSDVHGMLELWNRIVTVDTILGIIKLVRIGDNVDHYLRSKRTLCYDYKNKRIIAST